MSALIILLAVAKTSPASPVSELIARLIGPERASRFELSIMAPGHHAGRFSIEPTSAAGGVALRGTDAVSLAAGFSHYLKLVNASFSWAATGGDNTAAALPPASSPLPPVKPTSRSTQHSRRYYFNTCTYGYSMVWWPWERWERELDWMAMQGVNTPLAMLGTEWAWRETLMKDFGIDRSDLDGFFSGPAYLPWHWMGNLDGWGGPLSDEWIERGRMLQHRFLKRARELGMTPVLPAFAGFVPAALQRKYPTAPIHDAARWGDFHPTHYLEPTSALFSDVGTAFIKRLCAEFGCDEKWFTADLYNELKPPSIDPAYLHNVSASVYASIVAGTKAADAESTVTAPVWLAQAWMWHHPTLPYRPPWTAPAIKAFLDGPPPGALVMLDLYAEQSPLWNETDGFWGHPWVFSTIFNFGGRSGLYGRVPHLSRAVPEAAAANQSTGASMIGLGAAPEAIETDPIVYDLLFETVWLDAPIDDPKAWVRTWAARRYSTYGVATPSPALDAWAAAVDGPYGVTRVQQGVVGSLIAARPNAAVDMAVECCDGHIARDLGYDPLIVLRAWEMLLASVPTDEGNPGGGAERGEEGREAAAASVALATKATFLHDVADFGLQALSNLAIEVHSEIATAFNASNRTAFHAAATRFLSIVDDAELLAATQQGRLLGQWIQAARACAEPISETPRPDMPPAASKARIAALADQYELNARMLISLWGNQSDSALHEYSYRLWGGHIATFYKPRWSKWFAAVDASLAAGGTAFNQTRFTLELEQWEEQWTRTTGVWLPTKPAAGALQRAREVHARHFAKPIG